MKTKTLAIGLLTDRIDVILCAGAQAHDSRRINIPFEHDPEKWRRQVHDAAKAVRIAAQEMGAIGLQARVLYRGPTACTEFASPQARTAAEAVSAAILSCADALSCPLDAAATRGFVVAFEKRDSDSKASIVVAADGDDTLAAIREMVTGAELKFIAATPLDAAIMAGVAKAAIDIEKGPAAILHFGEQSSCLVIAAEGSIVFARAISVGLEALTSSLTRPMRLQGGQTIELNHETARAIVHECGFPSRSQVVHEELQLTGGSVVPMLQPVLQRFMVEVRQSLRFALPENQRHEVSMRLTGPGARTPGFTQIVADELGIKVDLDDAAREFDYRDPKSTASELVQALASRRATSELGLEPLAMSQRRRMRQLQRWLWTGAAASLALIGFDAFRLQGRLASVRTQAASLQTQSEGMAAMKVTSDKINAAVGAMNTLENSIRRETGARVCMGAVLQELSRLTPPSIRLYSVSFRPGTDGVIGGLSGYALAEGADPRVTSSMLESYMQRLSESPLLHRLALANVQTTLLENEPAQSFDVSFEPLSAPVDQLSTAAALVSGESVKE